MILRTADSRSITNILHSNTATGKKFFFAYFLYFFTNPNWCRLLCYFNSRCVYLRSSLASLKFISKTLSILRIIFLQQDTAKKVIHEYEHFVLTQGLFRAQLYMCRQFLGALFYTRNIVIHIYVIEQKNLSIRYNIQLFRT